MHGEGEDVLTVSPGNGASLTKPDALVTQGGIAAGQSHAGPLAKRPTLDAAAADNPSSEVLCFATAPTSPNFGPLPLQAVVHGH